MGENLDNYSYNNTTDGFEQNLADEIKEVLKEETDILDKQGEEVIKSLDEGKLANYIETSFKTESGWLTYTEMRNHAGKFHGFMTQAAIDMLGSLDRYKEKKYDINGNVDNNGKTIDDWLKENGGVDNQYGGGTRKMVKMIQHILGIHEDGAAGPQFFAKICAVLRGMAVDSNSFKVKGNDNYRYNFNGTQETAVYRPGGRSTPETSVFQYTMPSGYTLGTPNNKKVPILNVSGEETGCYLEDTGLDNPVIKYVDGYERTIYGEFKFGSDQNSIIYVGPSQVVQEQETTPVNNENALFPGIDNLFKQYNNIAVKNGNGTCSYYAIDGTTLYVYGSDFKFDTTYSITDSDRYSHLRDDLGVGGFSSAFDCKYTDIKGIHDKKSDDENTLASLGSLLMSGWGKDNRISIAKWCMMDNSSTGTGGSDFISWCENMIGLGFDKNSLTIRTWLAFSRINENGIKNVLYKPASI